MAINKGTVAFSFGVDETYTGGTVTSLSLEQEYGNVGEVRDENGAMIAKRYDDIHRSGTMTVLLEAATVPGDALGTTFTYNAIVYYIMFPERRLRVCCRATGLNTTALINHCVYDDGTGPHTRNHVTRHHDGCSLTGCHNGSYDNIGGLDRLPNVLLRGHRRRNTSIQVMLHRS